MLKIFKIRSIISKKFQLNMESHFANFRFYCEYKKSIVGESLENSTKIGNTFKYFTVRFCIEITLRLFFTKEIYLPPPQNEKDGVINPNPRKSSKWAYICRPPHFPSFQRLHGAVNIIENLKECSILK